MMTRLIVVLVAVTVWLVLGVSAASPASAGCGSQITAGGHRWIVTSNVSCGVALPVARALATARRTGVVVRRGIRIVTFSSPRGWVCATPATNPRGRACSRGTDTVAIVQLG